MFLLMTKEDPEEEYSSEGDEDEDVDKEKQDYEELILNE